MKGKILLVEDDEGLGFVTKDNLEVSGYEVVWIKEGIAGKNEFIMGEFDLCILDVMLPRLDGFTLARHIRAQNEFVPIIFLTARSMEDDRLRGFEIGGDDYVTKPFSMKELLYRVEVFMRRTKPINLQQSSSMKIGEYTFDVENLQLERNGNVQSLTKMESQLLKLLMDYKNTVVKRSEILIRIWGEDDYFKGRSLDVFISRLRKYLQDDEAIEIRNYHSVGFLIKC